MGRRMIRKRQQVWQGTPALPPSLVVGRERGWPQKLQEMHWPRRKLGLSLATLLTTEQLMETGMDKECEGGGKLWGSPGRVGARMRRMVIGSGAGRNTGPLFSPSDGGIVWSPTISWLKGTSEPSEGVTYSTLSQWRPGFMCFYVNGLFYTLAFQSGFFFSRPSPCTCIQRKPWIGLKVLPRVGLTQGLTHSLLGNTNPPFHPRSMDSDTGGEGQHRVLPGTPPPSRWVRYLLKCESFLGLHIPIKGQDWGQAVSSAGAGHWPSHRGGRSCSLNSQFPEQALNQ
jgi:hypothetical protein